jgi:hypothetical protein
MKIIEIPFTTWTDKRNDYNEPIYKHGVKKINGDGKEILEWMRSMAKIKSFGIVEVPKYHTDCLGRFIDASTLKNGHYVLFYKVLNGGILRNWVSLHAPKFGNDGHCTQLSAISEASLQKSIMRYKDGKTIADASGHKVMFDFVERFRKAAANVRPGIPSGDLLRGMLENEFDIQLEKEYTLADVQKALSEGMTQNDINAALSYSEEETYGGIPESLHGKLTKFATR